MFFALGGSVLFEKRLKSRVMQFLSASMAPIVNQSCREMKRLIFEVTNKQNIIFLSCTLKMLFKEAALDPNDVIPGVLERKS